MNGGSDQKAMIAAKLRPYYEALAKDRQEAGNNQHTKRLVEKIPQAKKSRARDEAERAAGIFSEPSKKKIIHSKTPRVCQPPVFARN